jgi:hypothetical protein
MRVCRSYAIHNLLTESLLGVRCSPKDSARDLLREDDCETWADSRACCDEDDGFEECRDAQHTAGWDAAHVDVCRGALDGAASKVACPADDQGKSLAVGIGDCGEAVPILM